GWATVENPAVGPRARPGVGASIRPRLGDRGKPEAERATAAGQQGFNSATAGRPWKTASWRAAAAVQCRLQFGHGWATVENVGVADIRLADVDLASIRP